MSGPDFEMLDRVLQFMNRGGLSEVAWEKSGEKVVLKRQTESSAAPQMSPDQLGSFPRFQEEPPSVALQRPVAGAPSATSDKFVRVKSPFVGTFYRSPSPEADPYVSSGENVKKGQVLCIIEAMKLMNEIESEVAGKIVEVLVENGSPVEYDQPLFLIDPKA